MLLRQIRYFVSVVRHNSFTEAAEENFISQSAISQQIKALEDELGAQLLKREGRRFTVTRAGEYFYRKGLLILDELQRACHETARIAGGEKESLRVGYLCSYGGKRFQRAVAMFAERRPNVAMQIVSGNHEELYDQLRFGHVDIVLNDQRRAFSDEYVNLSLRELPCFAEVAGYSPLTALASITLEELRGLPCILVSSPAQREHEADYYRNTLAFSGEFLFAGSMEQARLMAAGNQGFFPTEGGESGAAAGSGIWRIPILRNGASIKRNFCAFWRRENENPYIAEFAQALQETTA